MFVMLSVDEVGGVRCGFARMTGEVRGVVEVEYWRLRAEARIERIQK